MTYGRMKNLGLLCLVLILVLICSAALLQTRRLSGILDDVDERLLPAMGVIYPIELLLGDANELFHAYHQQARVTPYDVRSSLAALGDATADLEPLVAKAPQKLRAFQEAVRHVVTEFDTLAGLLESDDRRAKVTAAQGEVVQAAVAALRVRLRALAREVAEKDRATARPILARASHLLRLAQQDLTDFREQGPSPIPSVLNLLDTADSRLVDLLELQLSTRLQEEIGRLRVNLTRLRSSVLIYQHDARNAENNTSVDTLDHAHQKAHDLWQQTRISGTWITRNLHREVWLSTEAATATSHRGQLTLLVLGLVGITVASVTALVLSRSLSRHISRVSLATEEFAAGNYANRLPSWGGDEMARLATTLNQMADKLQARDRDLARLAAAVEHITDGVLIAAPDGTVEYVNPAYQEITGVPAEDLVGRRLEAPVEERHPCAGEGRIPEVVTSGAPWTGRCTARRGDGREYQAFCSISPITNPGGAVERLAVVVRDITRDVQIEERVKESQKLQALGTLTGGIAHDFNNLLVPILGYAEMLLMRTPEQDPAHRKLQRVASAAERAKELVEQVLTFSRASAKEKMPLRLAPLVKEVVKLVGINLPGNIAVHIQVEGGLPPVLGDPVQLHQSLMNLLTNATHAMEPDGGRLEILLERETAACQDGGPRGGVCLTVSDTGCGMSPEVRARIFDPFFTTKGIGKGTGLGLSVVHGIVEDHGGTIEVDSQPGNGTRFRLHFPASIAEVEPAREPPVAPQRGAEHILLVEDDPGVAEVLQEVLEACGYRVTATDRAAKALELLAGPEARFDVVLTDQRMPGMSGTQLIAALRERQPELPVVLCTGHYGAQGDLTPQTSGAQAVVFKPVHPDDLGRVVRSVLDRDTEIGRTPPGVAGQQEDSDHGQDSHRG